MSLSRTAAAGAALAVSGLAVFGLQASASATPSPKPTKSNCPNPAGNYPPGQCGYAPGQVSDSRPTPGQKEHVHGEGFQGGSDVTVEVHSAPILLGTFQADSAGVLNADVTLPTGLSLGAHSLVLRGVAANGSARTVTIPITVVAAGSSSTGSDVVQLPHTGAEIGGVAGVGIALVGGGSAAVYTGRRRRQPTV